MWRGLRLFGACCALMGCGDSGSPPASGDSGPRPADVMLGPVVPALPEPPADPAPPVLIPCPEGWREVRPGGGEPPHCDPWPLDRRPCEPGWSHFPGDDFCERVGTECPPGGWPGPLPPTGAIHHVLASATPGGDGSQDTPFATIAEALAVATAGSTILVGAGTYDEPVYLPPGVVLLGVCATETVLTSTTPTGFARGVINGADATVRNVRIEAPLRTAIVATPGGTLRVSNVIVRNATGAAFLVGEGASLLAETILVDGGVHIDHEPLSGIGLLVRDGGQAEMTRAVFFDTAGAGVRAQGEGSRLVLAEAAITRVRNATDDAPGFGVDARGGTVELRSVLVERSYATLVAANGPGALVARDLVLRDVTLGTIWEGSLIAKDGGRVEVDRVLIERTPNAMLADTGAPGVPSETAELVARDVIARELVRSPRGAGATGLIAHVGGRIDVRRAFVAGELWVGLAADGSTAHYEDIVVRGATAPPAGRGGAALIVDDYLIAGTSIPATVTVRRIRLEESRPGAWVMAGSRLEGSDLTITDTVDGHGLLGVQGQIALERVLVRRSAHAALHLEGGRAEIDDLHVEHVLASGTDGTQGRGIELWNGAEAILRRVLVERAHESGVVVFEGVEPGTAPIVLEDLVVRDVTLPPCAIDGSCVRIPGAAGGNGHGIAVLAGSPTVQRFDVDGVDRCGVLVTGGGSLDLIGGRIAHAQIGACISRPDFDPMRLTQRVRFEEVGTTFSTMAPEIPERVDPPPSP
jgi:hypothetical protein